MKKIALITGSSRGIGKAIAIRLAQDNFKIILHGLHKSLELKSTEKELKKNNSLALTICFDVSKKQEVESACSSILKKIGAVDVLVNNAGIIRDRTFIKMSEKEWDDVIKTNLYGPFYVTKQLLTRMKKCVYGRIINISSIVALKGNFGQTNYAASKAGLIGMTKSLAREVAKYNITVNAVSPGFIGTQINSAIPEKYRQQMLSQVALRRIGKPSEVASIVSYLASKESSYITGAVIDVNGGWII